MITNNPANLASAEILEAIVELDVVYLDFEGVTRSGVMEVHKSVAQDVCDFFALALQQQFPIEKVVRSSDSAYLWDDDKLLEDNATSGFNYRYIKDTTTPSLHGRGLAIDVNTRLNPFIRYIDGETHVDPAGAVYEPGKPGVFVADDPLVSFMKQRGWSWGGDWTKESGRIDYQHFEKSQA